MTGMRVAGMFAPCCMIKANTPMRDVALITGASSGIGHEMALLFAEKGIDVLLVARNEGKLLNIQQAMTKDYPVKVYTLATDLSTPEGVDDILDFVKATGLRVAYLVNNAGFGVYGNFIERSWQKYAEMIALNVESLTALTYHFGRQMADAGKGRILNVASTAGFQPDPYFAAYGATKAYVISLTEALHKELESSGVTVTVLSPGATRTEFMDRADMGHTKLFDSGVMSARDVAHVGFQGMMQGKLHVIPGWKNRVMAFFSSITPSSKWRLALTASVMGTKDQ